MGSAPLSRRSKPVFAVRCPNCGTSLPLWRGLRWRFSRQGRRGKRQCPSCGAWLELANGSLLSALYGLVLGLLLVSSHFWRLGNDWVCFGVVVLLAVVLGLTVAPWLVVRFGRWQAVAGGPEDSAEVRRWSRLVNLSAWVALAALVGMWLCIWLQVRRLSSGLAGFETPAALDAHMRSGFTMLGISVGVGLAAATASIGVSIYAARRRQKARQHEHQAKP